MGKARYSCGFSSAQLPRARVFFHNFDPHGPLIRTVLRRKMNEETVPCSKCSAEMFGGARFCMVCGTALARVSPRSELDLDFELGEAPSRPGEPERSSTQLRATGALWMDSAGIPRSTPRPELGPTPLRAPESSTALLTLVPPPRDGAARSAARVSARPSAVPFMESPAADSELGLADPNARFATPGTMSEALLRASQWPQFSIDDIDDGFVSLQDTTSADALPSVNAFVERGAAEDRDERRPARGGALARLTSTLRELHDRFEASRQGWSRGDRELKRRVLREREEALEQLNLLLTQLGEFSLMGRLEKLPFELKLTELERFLDAAQGDTARLSRASGGE